MPAPTTSEDLLELVRKSGVVEEKRLNTYLDKVRAAASLPQDPSHLAGVLVRDGILTRFQAEQFLQGKWRRFTLGKYKVLERLGSGGMGTVYLCEHKLMRRRVAVKVLPTAKAEDASALERFYREARAVAALDHPNIVRAYDIDQDDNLHFLVMEHVDGSSLQEIVKKAGPMDAIRACHYIRQAALGLQHAHEAATIVHRDIKPGNILVDRNGIVKVLDMGLARFFRDEDDVLTKKFDENVLGTADYLAPEQAMDSHSVDIRADIYSLGATFYFCLSGRTPFNEGSVAQKLIWHQTRQPRSLRLLRPELQEGIVAVVEKMMTKDPGQRYQTPREVAEALSPWTQTPIPPPPESEMPQLSLAAMGGPGSFESGTMSSRPSTTEVSPSPRKAWQVPSTCTPRPAPSLPAGSSAPSPPPSSALERIPTPALPCIPASPRSGSSLPARSVQAATRESPASLPATQPVGNGSVSTAPQVPPNLAPVEAPAEAPWGDFVRLADPFATTTATLPGVKEEFPSTTRRSARRQPAGASKKVWWMVGGISTAAAIATVAIVLWMSGHSTSGPVDTNNTPPLLKVNRSGQKDTFPTITSALERARSKPTLGAHILVQSPVQEEVTITLPNITIEADSDQPIVWKAPAHAGRDSKLLSVCKAADFRLKGFVLDGDNRVDCLVMLYNLCPGTVLEDLTFQGFRQYGCSIANCAGGDDPDRHLVLQGLSFVTTHQDQAGLYFTILKSISSVSKDRNIVVRNPRFDGPGGSILTPHRSFIEDCEIPVPITEKK